ncbi:hypothetical protein [Sphingomonas sp. CARO-RG-8B-R24-01]|uniref:hypothetical protein n=1 Tax=Sphingomonas sp. CARO-RG-8B-R24-01 TaxID=2914831 RepID=UPI001F5840A5|nr:hypothetical protein [Sphingomonas sp. CARO-RG-8B-R24-01]
MIKKSHGRAIAMLVAIVVLLPQVSNAQTQPVAPASPIIAEASAASFGAINPVENADLKTITGQADLAQVVNAQNNGVVSGNTVTGNSQTGIIHFDSSSFQNLNGLSLLSANTGNNVSINSSLNVNVAINR